MPHPSVTFFGAARTVTGSMHYVQAAEQTLLLDCGLFQGRRTLARQRNRDFPFPPHDINTVILSHAHIDHCGNLPNLVRQGFSGPIYCTPATRDLIAVMLADSAKIQAEDAGYLNRKKKPGEPPIEPLYDQSDVVRMLRQVQSVPYERPFDLGRGLRFRFVEAGHLLGSAMVHLTLDQAGGERSLTFTGDLGRTGLPILRDPAPIPPADLVLCESTYGGRNHPPVDLLADSLVQVIQRSIQRGGKLLVPAFSLGRTQTLVYFLHQLVQAGKLPTLPIYVDSPLAIAATNVFRMHPECFDEEAGLLLDEQPQLFGEKLVEYLQTAEESKALNGRAGPMLIIAASGMCESGRILHHLKQNIANPNNTILIIGYQAPDTLGRRIVEKQPQIRIHDAMIPLRAEVVVMNGFSSHADRTDLLRELGRLRGFTKKIRLVHCEMDQAEPLATALREQGFDDVAIPDRGEKVDW